MIALTVFGVCSTGVLLKKLSGFAALFALLSAGTTGALAHFEAAALQRVE